MPRQATSRPARSISRLRITARRPIIRIGASSPGCQTGSTSPDDHEQRRDGDAAGAVAGDHARQKPRARAERLSRHACRPQSAPQGRPIGSADPDLREGGLCPGDGEDRQVGAMHAGDTSGAGGMSSMPGMSGSAGSMNMPGTH